MLKNQINESVLYKRLHEQFNKHPGPIDQYIDLRRMLRKSGFECKRIFRGKEYKKDWQSGRHEIWVNFTSSGNSKIGFGDSLGEAVKKAVKVMYPIVKKF